jgi:hypothetical protein
MEIGFNKLFENLLYHIMGEYYALCILQALKMCIFEVVSHSIDIVNYLVFPSFDIPGVIPPTMAKA